MAWDDATRLVGEGGAIRDGHAMGFSERHRVELVVCLATPERMLDGKRITDCFSEDFFTTDFWYMWCTTFAFEPWHSAIEFRRYLRRFVHLFPEFETMSGIHRTRYNQYDSIVRPLTAWLLERGVRIHTGHRVTDLSIRAGPGTSVERIHFAGAHADLPVAPQDLVFVTNGSMTADSTLGSHTAPPEGPHTDRSPSSFLLWHRIARDRDDFGRPEVFDRSVADSTWESFTVTAKDPAFLEWMETFTGRATGRGGLLTLTDSPWLLTVVVNRQPVYQQQPEDVSVWWGYGLLPDKPGTHVRKPMRECSGEEILQEAGSRNQQRIPSWRSTTPTPPGCPAMLWAAEWPPARHLANGAASGSSNPVADYHLIYALLLTMLAAASAGDSWGLGRRWAVLPVVRDHPWLR